MTVSYKKLWKLLIDKDLKKKDLLKLADISTSTLAKMGKDQLVSMDVLMRLCKAMRCNIGDIVDYISDEEK
jgi:DNA-binding Xre family transcriptional regulator